MLGHIRTDDRARLTPVDIVYYGVALLLLGFLAEPMYLVLNDQAGELGTGSGLLFQMIFPSLVVTLMFVVFLTGVSGGAN